jgi:hypothetical protein
MIDPSPVEEEAPILNTYMSRTENDLGHGSRGDLKPGMTVLARASSNLTDQVIDGQLSQS